MHAFSILIQFIVSYATIRSIRITAALLRASSIASLILTDDPGFLFALASLSTTRFALPFVILALIVHPSLPLPAPSHLRATRAVLPSTYPASVPLPSPLRSLFPSMYDTNTPAASRAPFGTTDPPPPPTPALSPSPPPATSAAPQHEHRDAAHEGAPEAQAQHYEDYDARFALKHHCTDINPFSAAPLITPARATHCGGSWAVHFAFHYYCLYLPTYYINTTSTPPCITRVIVGCPWLLLVVLEPFVVVGMWLCLTTIISWTFLYRRYFYWDCVEDSPRCLLHPELSSRVPRRLFFCRDQIIFVTLFFCSNLFTRRSPPEPTTASPSDAVSFPPPADHSHPVAVHFHHQAGTFLEGYFASPRLLPLAHMSL
ncbi:hypothetical protein C8J57DRAFT_1710519 [Mycena rebaudengoi]|nr:hypothetical protein C8J57DRAFT_1710519 [Mycena rebaudengoi]